MTDFLERALAAQLGRPLYDAINKHLADGQRAEAAIARVRALADHFDDALASEADRAYARAFRTALDGAATPATEATGFTPFTPAHIPKTGNPEDALVVEPYRNDHGQPAWVFRCWGTDRCDGWLSLDHTSQQSAERARDRHVTEAHTQEPADA